MEGINIVYNWPSVEGCIPISPQNYVTNPLCAKILQSIFNKTVELPRGIIWSVNGSDTVPYTVNFQIYYINVLAIVPVLPDDIVLQCIFDQNSDTSTVRITIKSDTIAA